MRPREIHDLLPNPGIGWQTFGRSADRDRNLPSWLPSTIRYERWGWGRLEPVPGGIDRSFLEKVFAETRRAGQRLAFRVMCNSTQPGSPYHPAWLAAAGGSIVTTRYLDKASLPIPDLDDPKTLNLHLDFLRRLGALLDGHPDIDHIDIGSVGWWGEWHMSNSNPIRMPRASHQRMIVDAYFEAFRTTPLVMLIGGKEMLAHAVRKGAGWRADCLGDMGGFGPRWNHMEHLYTQALAEAGALEAWRRAPVAWETCWDLRKWIEAGWPLRHIFNYALALHGSHFNNKSVPLPQDSAVHEEIRRFLRRLGYRLVLREWAHPAVIARGRQLPIAMQWQNVGSAPCYRPFRVAIRLRGPGGEAVLIGRTTVDRFPPGHFAELPADFVRNAPDLPLGEPVNVEELLEVPPTLAPGDYEVALGVVDHGGGAPVLRLAIEGRTDDGWYPLSRLRVVAE